MENESGNLSTENLDSEGVELESEEEEEEDGDIQNQVEKFLNKDNEKDSDDGPSWMFKEGETLSRDPEYVFCPAPHRKGILRLFTRHFCQHPLLLERDGKLSAEDIRSQAVYDMYNFCKVRGLREVWGYMWSSWYSPKMWCLWARSTSPRISRLRTTMAVENFWRQLKHNYLHNVARPRLDHLVWILINRVTPAYVARSEILDDNFRLGRTRSLTTYQKYFKKSWNILAKREVSAKIYKTDVKDWTCTCGRQKYDCHLLCKHLVQAVPSPPIRFWREVHRRRVLPIYQHPALVQKVVDGNRIKSADSDIDMMDPDGYIEPSGDITDGDDHIWSGDRKILIGGGGYKDLEKAGNGKVTKSVVLGKRASRNDSDDEKNGPGPSKKKQKHTDVEVIDLTMSSSPVPEPIDARAPSASPNARSSSPVNYVSDDENQVRIASHWQIMNLNKLTFCSLIYAVKTSYNARPNFDVPPKYSRLKSRLANQYISSSGFFYKPVCTHTYLCTSVP